MKKNKPSIEEGGSLDDTTGNLQATNSSSASTT